MRSLLMVHRGEESEPVVINTETAGLVVLELDDGDRLAIDARELDGALRGGEVTASKACPRARTRAACSH